MRTNTIRRVVLTCAIMVMGIVNLYAQNRIDNMVDNFSTLGSSKFTSVVERDPDTRKVVKVVKVLTVHGMQSGRFRDAFIKEKDTGSFIQNVENGEETMTLTCKLKDCARIYMLQQPAKVANTSCKVTLIVKYK